MNNVDRVIELCGAVNVRELGGIPLRNNRFVKRGKIIRAGRLSNLTEDDCILLTEKWNVTRIVDLRNNNETAEYPDIHIEGTVHQQIAIISDEKEGISREDYGRDPVDRAIMRAENLLNGDGARRLLVKMYAQMAADDYCVSKMKEFFDMMLAHEEGTFIWHCTSGKDRTGVTGALILYAMGADMQVIKEDYLYTNIQNNKHCSAILSKMKDKNASEAMLNEIQILETVYWEYMESFFKEITRRYGSIENFLAHRMELTDGKLNILKEKYTEKIQLRQTNNF